MYRSAAPAEDSVSSPPRAEIGLDHKPAGISTDSARDPETTGTNQHISGNTDTSTADPLWRRRPASRVNDRYIRRSGYRTSSPVTARPMIIRWISDVPSKIVKILASRCRRSPRPSWKKSAARRSACSDRAPSAMSFRFMTSGLPGPSSLFCGQRCVLRLELTGGVNRVKGGPGHTNSEPLPGRCQ